MEIHTVFILLCVLSTFTLTNSFPRPRKCSFSKSRKEMHCGNEHFQDFPYELIKDKDSESLYMELNQITILSTKGFEQLQHKTSLKKLYLYNNQIATIEPDSFRELSNLEILDLSYNKIKHVSKEFHACKQLRILNLEDNPIETISEDAFRKLEHLSFLSLKNCKIRRLPNDFLRGLKITELDLSGNCIENFEDIYLPESLVNIIAPEKCHGNETNKEAEEGDDENKAKAKGNFLRVNYFIVIGISLLFSVIL